MPGIPGPREQAETRGGLGRWSERSVRGEGEFPGGAGPVGPR